MKFSEIQLIQKNYSTKLIIGLFIFVSLFGNLYSQNEQLQPLEFGKPVPNLELGEWINKAPAPNQNPLTTNITVLEFWATWCGPCVKAIPHINELVDSLKDEPVFFLSVTKEPREKVLPFVQSHEMKAHVVLDNGGKTSYLYQVNSIPRVFIIHPSGVLIWTGHPVQLSVEFLRKIVKDYYKNNKQENQSTENTNKSNETK